jgi:hypothetical protein
MRRHVHRSPLASLQCMAGGRHHRAQRELAAANRSATDAHAERVAGAPRREVLRRGQDIVPDAAGPRGVEPRHQQGELLLGEARDQQTVVPRALGQQTGQLGELPIAAGHLDEEQREPAGLAAARIERPAQRVVEAAPRRRAGRRIALRLQRGRQLAGRVMGELARVGSEAALERPEVAGDEAQSRVERVLLSEQEVNIRRNHVANDDQRDGTAHRAKSLVVDARALARRMELAEHESALDEVRLERQLGAVDHARGGGRLDPREHDHDGLVAHAVTGPGRELDDDVAIREHALGDVALVRMFDVLDREPHGIELERGRHERTDRAGATEAAIRTRDDVADPAAGLAECCRAWRRTQLTHGIKTHDSTPNRTY